VVKYGGVYTPASLHVATASESIRGLVRVLKSSIIDYENPIIVIDYDYEGL